MDNLQDHLQYLTYYQMHQVLDQVNCDNQGQPDVNIKKTKHQWHPYLICIAK